MKKALIALILVIVSLFQVSINYTGKPQWALWGNPKYVHYDPAQHIWINNNTQVEGWRYSYPFNPDLVKPEQVPEKKKVKILFNPIFLRPENSCDINMAIACAVVVPNRRLRLVNVEESINELRANHLESRIWPHLGILYVGTMADNEGWDVAIHDELVQGYVNLEQFIQSGDVVGLSLVVTGIERGVELARQAKRLGASYVIAGNDSAIFRADQLLRLADHPIDAVFTTNSLTSIRQFLRQVGTVENEKIYIPGVAIVPTGVSRSNERDIILAERHMQAQLQQQGLFDPQDVFIVPKLNLYSDAYWQTVWQNYRTVFGHKHKNSLEVRNALGLFAQGCTRTGSGNVCSYCSIAGVADIRFPSRDYLAQLLEVYQDFGINYVYNTTDSAFEMRNVVSLLKDLGAYFPEGLVVYGRARGLAYHPELIEEWLSLTGGRLLVNTGMDSGDERMLNNGIIKASKAGSRLEENMQAIRNIAKSGVHLHYSLIFGSPGETRESCEKSMEFFEWTCSVLGQQLDQCETDLYWLSHGSPASRIFHDYGYARQLAMLAGKAISRETWESCFHCYRDSLAVPWECEVAWYDLFTSITIEEAQKYNAYISSKMATHKGAAPSRAFRPC